jgi:hypothetical protein
MVLGLGVLHFRAGMVTWFFCFLSATLGWFAGVFARIREVVSALHTLPVCAWLFCWHPRFVSVLQALPLCGAAPTFLCRRKEK